MASEIKICMGSACFAKGSRENLEFIKQYIKENNLEAEVSITGALCEDKCSIGPRVVVNGAEYTNITVPELEKILKEQL